MKSGSKLGQSLCRAASQLHFGPSQGVQGPGPHFAACSSQHTAHPAKAPHGGPVVDPTEHLATRMQMAPPCITLPC